MATERERLLNARNCAAMRMRRAGRALGDFYNATMEPSGLHANQFVLLVPPYLNEGMTINQLAEFAGLDRTTLTRNLQVLVKLKLITLDPGQDQRTRVVHVTDLGRHTLLKALPLWEKAQKQVLAYLGQSEAAELYDHLDKLEEQLRSNQSG